MFIRRTASKRLRQLISNVPSRADDPSKRAEFIDACCDVEIEILTGFALEHEDLRVSTEAQPELRWLESEHRRLASALDSFANYIRDMLLHASPATFSLEASAELLGLIEQFSEHEDREEMLLCNLQVHANSVGAA